MRRLLFLLLLLTLLPLALMSLFNNRWARTRLARIWLAILIYVIGVLAFGLIQVAIRVRNGEFP